METNGDVQGRRLALRQSPHDLCSASWARAVQSIPFDGSFPLARLQYLDASLPVQVAAEVLSGGTVIQLRFVTSVLLTRGREITIEG
jgi:hypothetical protein